jgi:oligoribonuclease (3'-5' exoribonuclease)
VKQLPNESIHGIAGETPVQERTLHILEDTSDSQISETAHNQNEVNEICIEEHHGNLITEVLTASELRNLQTQQSFISAESTVGNIETVKNSGPQLEQPRAETQLTICGEPFTFNTFLR